MTVQTVPRAVLADIGVGELGAIVKPARMSAEHMALLTQRRRFPDQHAAMAGSMGVMAQRAVLPYRKMFKQHGATLVSMTAMTDLVDRSRTQRRWSVAAVRVVAVGTLHGSFPHRHVCGALQSGTLATVAGAAVGGLAGIMYAVAARAAEIGCRMGADMPVQSRAVLVAGQACGFRIAFQVRAGADMQRSAVQGVTHYGDMAAARAVASFTTASFADASADQAAVIAVRVLTRFQLVAIAAFAVSDVLRSAISG